MSERVAIQFPKDTQEGTQSFLSKWLKKKGDEVALYEPIAEVSTDKVIMEVSSPAAGIIDEMTVKENAEIKPGDILGFITPSAARHAPPSPTQIDLSPAVKKMLREHGLSAADVSGTGRGGRITTEDIQRHVESTASASVIPGKKLPHQAMRKAIARHLSDSLLKIAPHVTTVFECDLSAVLRHKTSAEAQGAKATLTAYFVYAVAQAVRAVPEVNSRWYDEFLEVYTDVNVGIGTATKDGGLVVPVIRGVQELELDQISERINDVVVRARDNDLTRDDLSDGTITISNYGMSGSLFASPIIIHQPQSAIIGVGKLEKRAKVISRGGADSIEIRPCVFATLTIDHRVLDGFKANAFMSAFAQTLESFA